MPCYHPFAAVPDHPYAERGKKDYKLVGAYYPDLCLLYPNVVAVPCGKCIGCRLDYSRQWADRMYLEMDHTKKAMFVTLTYNDVNLPRAELTDFPTLKKEDMQKFMKCLRGRDKFELDKTELRFFGCGEYGTSTHRPHMHIILFGTDLEDWQDKKFYKHNKLFQELWTSEEFNGIWKKGYCILANASWETMAYTARYVVKKVYSDKLPWPGSEPEFTLMSRRPGIGAYYMEEHNIDFENNTVGFRKGNKISVPKYLLKRLENCDPVMYDTLMEKRIKLAQDKELLKLQNTELDYQQVLHVEELKRLESVKKLGRSEV